MNLWGIKFSFDQTGKGLCDSFKNTRSLLAETILYISHMIRRNFKDGGRAVLSHSSNSVMFTGALMGFVTIIFPDNV